MVSLTTRVLGRIVSLIKRISTSNKPSRYISANRDMETISPLRHQHGFINKEILIAITLGFAIGLVVTYGIWTANHSLKQQQSVSPVPTTAAEQTASTENAAAAETGEQAASANATGNEFSLLQPPIHTLTEQTSITISGFAPVNNSVVILSETGEIGTTPDAKGEFSSEIKLTTGINYITVFSIAPDGQSQRIDRTIILSS